MKEFRKNIFISDNGLVNSFSLRASAIIQVDDSYLMVLNTGANKYKHPGGHINLNESLLEGLKRELNEEIGLEIEEADTESVFFDSILRDKNLMINAIFKIKIDSETAQSLLPESPLPIVLLKKEELNDENTWESEINAIDHYKSIQ